MTSAFRSCSLSRRDSVIDKDSLASAEAASWIGFGFFYQTFDWTCLAKVQKEVQVDPLVPWEPRSLWLVHVAERTGGKPATFTIVDLTINSYGFLFSWNQEYQPRSCQSCVMMVFSDTLLPLGRRRLRLVPLRSASVAMVTQNTSHVRSSAPQHRAAVPLRRQHT